jgi:hypothetical protein
MNAKRRGEIRGLEARIELLRDELDALREEEQEYFDNMPESLQAGDRGERAEAAVAALDEAIEGLDDATTALAEALDA